MPADHPLRPIRAIVEVALGALSGAFAALYSHLGRPSIPPERLLRALLLQASYSARSARLLMEQLDSSLLFRWLVGLGIDHPVWHPSAFTTHRDRLLEGEVAARFLAAVLDHARVRQLLSRAHCSVDGTLIEAWASSRASAPRITSTSRRPAAATVSGTFTASSGATPPMPRPPIARRGWSATAPARKPSSASWAIC